MSLDDEFRSAQERVKALSARPSNATLLELYAFFKQGSSGDVSGNRPGMLDIKGRAKFDAWSLRKGMSRDTAQRAYVELVNKLLA